MTNVSPVQKIVEAHNTAIVGSCYIPGGGPVSTVTSYPENPDAPTAQPWQAAAWSIWQCLGELKEPTSYLARVISRRIDWRVSTPMLNDDDMDVDASRLLIENAVGVAVDELVRLIVLNVEVAGEFWIVRDDNDGENRPRWSIYSVLEHKLKEKIDAARNDGRPFRRVWVADPVNPSLADAATRGVLEPAYDLMELTALSRAQSRSRIASAGILLVPAEQRFQGGDPFGANLEEAMIRPIRDVNSPGAVAPIKIEMSEALIEKVKHLSLDRPFDDKVPEKIERATRRIAMGMDYPPELLLGLGDLTHWNAWVTQEEAYRGTIAPLAELVASVLAWIVRAELNQDVTIIPDPTELLTRNATVQDAINGAKVGAVSLSYVRKALGAMDEDAQPLTDTNLIIALQTGVAPGGVAPQSTTDTRSAPNEGVAP